MQHHAYVIAGESEAGIETARATLAHARGTPAKEGSEAVVLRYGVLSVEEVRKIISLAATHSAVIIVASRLYHEAQNALLKLFEEPPPGTTLFLILPELGGLLPTLRSRVAILHTNEKGKKQELPKVVEEFIAMSKEKRSAYIKKLTMGTDEDARREARDEALVLVNGVEVAAYTKWHEGAAAEFTTLLAELGELRGYLYDRSAPLKMILEHLALTLPKGLAK